MAQVGPLRGAPHAPSRDEAPMPDRFALWVAAAAVLVVAFGAGLMLAGESLRTAISDLGLIFATLIATAACGVGAARASGRTRIGWILMSASSLSWGIGEIIWSIYELGLGREVPFPSLADVGYLAAIPLAAAGLLSFPGAPEAVRGRLRTLLDGLIIAASLLVVSWVTVLGPTYRSASEEFLKKAIGLAYPLGDLALISLVAFLAIRTLRGGRTSLALLGGGVLALAIADSGFAYLTLHNLYTSGQLLDTGWFAGYLLIALAALKQGPMTSKRPVERASLAGIVLPYGAVLVAITVAALTLVLKRNLDPFVFWNSIAIALLVTARQLLTLLENLSLSRNLEDKVRGRTAELERALERVADSHKMQEEFVANTSHELRTPLTVIKGSLSTLRRLGAEASPDAKELLESADRNTERMAQLVEDLLATTALQANRQVRVGPLDVVSELRAVLAEFSPRGKVLEVRIPERLTAMGEPLAFRTVIRHLLSNAEKFAPEGTKVTIEAQGLGPAVAVSVSDEGPGIPRDQRERVFEQFVQVDASATRQQGGVGLGLFVAARMAQSMGGRLELDERAQPGATFRLILRAGPA